MCLEVGGVSGGVVCSTHFNCLGLVSLTLGQRPHPVGEDLCICGRRAMSWSQGEARCHKTRRSFEPCHPVLGLWDLEAVS